MQKKIFIVSEVDKKSLRTLYFKELKKSLSKLTKEMGTLKRFFGKQLLTILIVDAVLTTHNLRNVLKEHVSNQICDLKIRVRLDGHSILEIGKK